MVGPSSPCSERGTFTTRSRVWCRLQCRRHRLSHHLCRAQRRLVWWSPNCGRPLSHRLCHWFRILQYCKFRCPPVSCHSHLAFPAVEGATSDGRERQSLLTVLPI